MGGTSKIIKFPMKKGSEKKHLYTNPLKSTNSIFSGSHAKSPKSSATGGYVTLNKFINSHQSPPPKNSNYSGLRFSPPPAIPVMNKSRRNARNGSPKPIQAKFSPNIMFTKKLSKHNIPMIDLNVARKSAKKSLEAAAEQGMTRNDTINSIVYKERVNSLDSDQETSRERKINATKNSPNLRTSGTSEFSHIRPTPNLKSIRVPRGSNPYKQGTFNQHYVKESPLNLNPTQGSRSISKTAS